MKRVSVAVIVAACAVALGAETVRAKGPYSARVCGFDACRVVRTLPPLVKAGSPVIAEEGTPPGGPFYRITIKFKRKGSVPLRLVYVPSTRLISGFGGWKRVDSRFPSRIRKTLRGIAPFPAPAE